MMNTLFFLYLWLRRRYSVSGMKKKSKLSFCISLDFSYLCFAKVVNSYSEIR